MYRNRMAMRQSRQSVRPQGLADTLSQYIGNQSMISNQQGGGVQPYSPQLLPAQGGGQFSGGGQSSNFADFQNSFVQGFTPDMRPAPQPVDYERLMQRGNGYGKELRGRGFNPRQMRRQHEQGGQEAINALPMPQPPGGWGQYYKR